MNSNHEEFYGFFDGELIGTDDDGYQIFDREYDSQEFSDFFQSFFDNGIYPDSDTNSLGSQLLVKASKDFNVIVSPGQALINGRNYRLKGERKIQLDDPDISFNRIDNIVLRLDLDERLIKLDVVTGVPGSRPQAPELTRTDRVYELLLAQVTLEPNSKDIKQSNIRDTRHIKELCGIVSAAVQGIDVSKLYLQYEAGLKELVNELNEILESENIAGELLALINTKADKLIIDENNNNKFELIFKDNIPYFRYNK